MEQNNQCTCPLCNREFIPADGLSASEHLAQGILGAYAEIQGKGEDNTLPCPRCGEHSMSTNVLHNALSRHFDIHICDICGNQEAVAVANGTSFSLESWWAVSAILGRK